MKNIIAGIDIELPDLKKPRPMCYYTALIVPPQQLALRFGRAWDRVRDFRPVYRLSAFRHAPYPVVTADPYLGYFRWGLIPFWTATLEEALAIRNRTANARAETIFRKPSFREPIRKRRCLIPVSGFFDWRDAGGYKVPYYVTSPGEAILALAGIYDRWYNRQLDEWVETYAVITTEANSLMSRIHNTNLRMPAILPRADEPRWLDPDLDESAIGRMLRPYAGELEGRPVGRDLLRRDPYDPAIVAADGPVIR